MVTSSRAWWAHLPGAWRRRRTGSAACLMTDLDLGLIALCPREDSNLSRSKDTEARMRDGNAAVEVRRTEQPSQSVSASASVALTEVDGER